MTDERLAEIEAWVDSVDPEEGRGDPIERAAHLSRACAHILTLLAEVRRRGQVIVQMQQAIDELGDSYD